MPWLSWGGRGGASGEPLDKASLREVAKSPKARRHSVSSPCSRSSNSNNYNWSKAKGLYTLLPATGASWVALRCPCGDLRISLLSSFVLTLRAAICESLMLKRRCKCLDLHFSLSAWERS